MAKTLLFLDSKKNHFAGNDAELVDGKLAVTSQVLVGGGRDGVMTVTVTNGDFSFTVVPTRGMSVHRASYKGEFIGWDSPVNGPVHPAFVDVGEPSGLGWLDGFDELMCRCGLESNGAPEHDEDSGRLIYPVHGRIGNKSAHHVIASIDGDEVTLTGITDEVRFHFLKLRLISEYKIKLGENGFRLKDTVENLSASPAEMQMLYHTNFGVPLLDGGSNVVAPIKTLVPRDDRAATGVDGWETYGAPEPGYAEQVYFMELLADANGHTKAMLKNAKGTRGTALSFSTKQLPCLTVWKNTTAIADGYVTGLEPGTNFPNARSYEGQQGRFTTIAGGGKTEFDFALEYVVDDRVSAVEAEIKQLQGAIEPTIHQTPQPGWCGT